MKVLIVDDHALARIFIREMIRPMAREVFECTNGPDALRLYGEILPDVVTMDLMMEGMSGIEATRLITQAFPKARVIVVSAYNDAEAKLAAMDAGAFAFIGKGNLPELRALLQAAELGISQREGVAV
jgi:CheY-like chemotaxis protein